MAVQIDQSAVDDATSDWPQKPSELAEQLTEKYGMPDEATMEGPIWHDVGEWKRVQLSRDGTPHNFPKEHEDHIRQTIDPEVCSDLIAFDGSNVLYRTRGELAADCHREATNFLTINLAHDIVTGEKTVAEAREEFAETAVKTEMGMEPPYTQGLQFDVPRGDQGDPDEVLVTEDLEQRIKREMGED